MDTPEDLRKLVEWYRGFAELAGSDEERRRRHGIADHLERLAREREQAQGDSERRS